jgi:hypothetical protein
MLLRHDDLGALCFALGWIAQNWAMVEQNFEMCIAMIYHDLGGKTAVSRKLPLPWDQKVESLRTVFNKILDCTSMLVKALHWSIGRPARRRKK